MPLSRAIPCIVHAIKIGLHYRLAKIGKKSDLDTALQHGDKIHIPPYSQEIYVLGEPIA